ncbi:MAG: AraC family transcriptional regulator [Candidatus Desulfovibrio kirbyi]|uniref:AraC family transcriptional regulator n=1 Tax=Candidatus Desulfovibrio kirbyi TaxID=2696086 RepID=A0A6L2R7B8_9BACT|nr:MAG: AraC family transcriptional regulator [Candidatus Desulfovibrio kirbyi]
MADDTRMEFGRAKVLLKNRLHDRMPKPGDYPTTINGLTLYRRDRTDTVEKCLYRPLIAMICQGAKRILVGSDQYCCSDNDIMIVGVDVPASTSITQASPEAPCMSMVLDLDKNLLAQLALETPHKSLENGSAAGGLLIQPVESGILDAFFRMAELLDTPERIPVLAPMIAKEIHYYLLIGPNGSLLRSFYALGSQNNQITHAISWLQQNLTASVLVDELAEQVNMSPSTFHRRFKEITSMSPVQFQKRIRLHEAQRMMLTDNIDASRASMAVGYENFSQFSREYKRLFGDPPRRDVMRIRNTAFA